MSESEDDELRNEVNALRERVTELEGFFLAEIESQKRTTSDRIDTLKQRLFHLREYTTLGIAGVGLAIALWGATPEARSSAANTWITGISASLLGALSLTIQNQKPEQK